jgi:hypothetical protein
MEIVLICCVIFYCIYLNFRIKDLQEEVMDLTLDLTEIEIKVYNKMMEIRRQLKDEKPRRKSTKKRSRVPENAVPKGKVLCKPRRNKNIHKAGGKG